MNTYGRFLNFSINFTDLQDSIQTLRANLHYQKNIESVFVSYRACVTHWKAIPVTFHLQRILSMAQEPMFSLLPVRLCHTAQWTCVGTTQQPIARCLSKVVPSGELGWALRIKARSKTFSHATRQPPLWGGCSPRLWQGVRFWGSSSRQGATFPVAAPERGLLLRKAKRKYK